MLYNIYSADPSEDANEHRCIIYFCWWSVLSPWTSGRLFLAKARKYFHYPPHKWDGNE